MSYEPRVLSSHGKYSGNRWRWLYRISLLRKLLAQGHSVVVVDNLSTGFADAVPHGATLYRIDIAHRERIRELLSREPVEAVFHFAAKAVIPESMSNPGVFFDANVAAGIALLEEIRRAGIRKFVFSSSAAVYGQPESMPITENHPKNPLNSYGETKLMFERVLSWYGRAYGWGVAALRYFNACGAWDDFGERHEPETHIIPLLLQAISGESTAFNIFGEDFSTPDGTCLRDYVHVLDIADAHIRTLHSAGYARNECIQHRYRREPFGKGNGPSS